LDVVQDEWIVKRRNCAATLNNRGSKLESTYSNVGAFFMHHISFTPDKQTAESIHRETETAALHYGCGFRLFIAILIP